MRHTIQGPTRLLRNDWAPLSIWTKVNKGYALSCELIVVIDRYTPTFRTLGSMNNVDAPQGLMVRYGAVAVRWERSQGLKPPKVGLARGKSACGSANIRALLWPGVQVRVPASGPKVAQRWSKTELSIETQDEDQGTQYQTPQHATQNLATSPHRIAIFFVRPLVALHGRSDWRAPDLKTSIGQHHPRIHIPLCAFQCTNHSEGGGWGAAARAPSTFPG